ncbi:pilin [Entomomonas asaccharolytica]|uniref:Pilin n=1 Tax=Entomomonas asaccharolytica TaxID=2785331 RepID=A0A974RW08_9GAMM|nr:pilin [Entomomonas asaccharolytica]QQP84726.1 pilin [Entomomonas asaccharolytica]
MGLIRSLMVVASCLLVANNSWTAVNPPTIQDKGDQQFVTGFVLGSVVAYALHNYYSYYQQCPEDIQVLNLPDMNFFADSPLEKVSVTKQCTLSIHYKKDATIAEGLRGKTLTIKEAMTSGKEQQSFTGECSFNGDSRYAPAKDCQLTAKQQAALTPQILALGTWYSKLYSEQGAVPSLKAPMNEAVILAYEQKQQLTNYYIKHGQCPKNNQVLGILPAMEIKGAFVESVSVEGCDIIATLKKQKNLFPELQGKSLILRMVPTQQQGIFNWQCGSDAALKFLPKQCQSL